MSKPKILVFDIETKPIKVWTFRIGSKIRIGCEQIVEGERFDILCIGYQWLHEKTAHVLSCDLKTLDSSAMMEEFSKIAESADVVIGHNSDSFDIKQINTQRMMHGQKAISWPTSEDTLKQCRKHFAFPSYKLAYIAKLLGGEGKVPMELSDWTTIVDKRCPKTMAKMLRYCKRDVSETADVVRKIDPYVDHKASRSVIVNGHKVGCPSCGNLKSVSKGVYVLNANRQRRQCSACGHAFLVARGTFEQNNN